jgi:hypothetical protein
MNRVRILETYEEVVGHLQDLQLEEGLLRARFRNVVLYFPPEMETMLRPLIGQHIGILRTDIPDKPYLFRFLKKDPVEAEDEK